MRGALTTGTLVRGTATVTAAAFLALSAGPALAADPLAQAEGEAIRLSIGGQSLSDQVGGAYRVTDSGNGPQSSGNNQPRASLLSGQQAAQLGTLAQDARTTVRNGRGSSAACAGVAGGGASLVEVGDSGDFCITPGDTASLTAAQIDLDNLLEVSLVEGTPALDDLLSQVPGLGDVLGELNDGLNDQLAPFGSAGLTLDLGAIQSRCTAGPGATAEGSARLTDVAARLTFPDAAGVDSIDLVTFEPDPAPNTKVVTKLDVVVDLILDEVIDSLVVTGLPDEAADGLDEIREAVRENLTSRIAGQLGPLEQNVLDGTLNKQTRSPGAIEVTALDLKVLPAIADQVGAPLIDAQVGRSACGPGGEADQPTAPSEPSEPARPDAPPAGGTTPQNPAVPRSVPAGLADDSDGVPPMLALAALTTLATATGLAVHRRRSNV